MLGLAIEKITGKSYREYVAENVFQKAGMRNTAFLSGIPGLYKRNGYAFELLFLPDSKEPFCIYKDGQNDGVAARFSYYPEEDISVTILSNQDCDVWDMTRQIQAEIYGTFYR